MGLSVLAAGAVTPLGQALLALGLGLVLAFAPPSLPMPGRRFLLPFVLLGGLWTLQILPLPPSLHRLLASETREALDHQYPSTVAPEKATWKPLTVSPHASRQRAMEGLLFMASILVGFSLTQQTREGAWGLVAVATISSLLILILHPALGWQNGSLWKELWNHAPPDTRLGPLPNRNHAATWLGMNGCLLFAVAWRYWAPWLRHHRDGGTPFRPHRDTRKAYLAVVALAGAWLGLISSQSRGGFLSLLAGLAFLVWIGRQRSPARLSPRTGLLLGILGLIWLAIGMDRLLERFAEVPDQWARGYSRFHLWRETWRLSSLFPWTGSGWGTFQEIFEPLASPAWNARTWHAENDYLQWTLEMGWPAMILLSWILVLLAKALVRRCQDPKYHSNPEPELRAGLVAAFVVCLAHGGVDFPWAIPSLACLAGLCLGSTWGVPKSPDSPQETRRSTGISRLARGLGCFLILVGLRSSWAVGTWQAAQSHAEQRVTLLNWTLRATPTRSAPRLALARERLLLNPQDPIAIQLLEHGVQGRPLSWEYRTEIAWALSASETHWRRALQEAERAVALHPGSPELPRQFGEAWIHRSPARALPFLREAWSRSPKLGPQVLDLVWTTTRQSEDLWKLCPDTPDCWGTLARWFHQNGLRGDVRECLQRLQTALPVAQFARLALDCGEPSLVLDHLKRPDNQQQKLLVLQALLDTGEHLKVLSEARIWVMQEQRMEQLSGSSHPEAWRHWERAEALTQDNRFEEAALESLKALQTWSRRHQDDWQRSSPASSR